MTYFKRKDTKTTRKGKQIPGIQKNRMVTFATSLHFRNAAFNLYFLNLLINNLIN